MFSISVIVFFACAMLFPTMKTGILFFFVFFFVWDFYFLIFLIGFELFEFKYCFLNCFDRFTKSIPNRKSYYVDTFGIAR